MQKTSRMPRALAALVTALAMAAGAAGCSGGSEGDGKDGTSGEGAASPSATPSNYLQVPSGIVLTPQGSALGLGDAASVAWQLDAKRIAAVEVEVTRVEQVPISRLGAWELDAKGKKSTPYFVTATVRNVGRGDLGGVGVPLYAAVGENSLVSPSSFESTFKPCPSTPLPKKFGSGKKASMCWVYLAPDRGTLEAVSFYTGPGFDPITWTGTIVKPELKKKPAKGGKKTKKKGSAKG